MTMLKKMGCAALLKVKSSIHLGGLTYQLIINLVAVPRILGDATLKSKWNWEEYKTFENVNYIQIYKKRKL